MEESKVIKVEEPVEMPAIPIHLWPFHKEVRVALIDEDAVVPTRNHWSDAGLDFYALYDTIIPPHSYKNIRTGITMEIPFGFFGLLKERGQSNFLIGGGVIDEGYQGEIIFKIFNTYKEPVTFLRGQPVGQMLFIPIIRPDIAVFDVADLHKEISDRGVEAGITEEI